MARSDMDTCSPVESRRSISRSGGLSLSAAARPTSSSVVLPMADTTATTSWPACFFAISFFATIWMRSGLATDVPPNLHTISDMRFLFRTGFRLFATIANNLVTTASNDGCEVVFSQRTYGRAGDIGPSGSALSVCGIAGGRMRARNARLARRAPAGGGIDQQAHDKRRPGAGSTSKRTTSAGRGRDRPAGARRGAALGATCSASRRRPRREEAARSSPPPSPRSAQALRPGRCAAAYENATNVNRNAADTIHMSGLTSRQWPCVTFTTT